MKVKLYRCPKCGKIYMFYDFPYLWCPSCYGCTNQEYTDITLVEIKGDYSENK